MVLLPLLLLVLLLFVAMLLGDPPPTLVVSLDGEELALTEMGGLPLVVLLLLLPAPCG